MKAISLAQPWAHLVVQGIKDIENRSWCTKHRGPILIHASRSLDLDALDWLRSIGIELSPDELDSGGIIGVVELIDCVRSHQSPWFSGPWGWVLSNPRPLEYKMVRGNTGIFKVDYEIDY